MNHVSFLALLLEKFLKVNNTPVEILKNPDVKSLDFVTYRGELRGALLNNDLYVWGVTPETADDYNISGDDVVVTHAAMIAAMGWKERPIIPVIINNMKKTIEFDGYSFSMSSLYYLEKPEVYEKIKSHPKIKALGYKFVE